MGQRVQGKGLSLEKPPTKAEEGQRQRAGENTGTGHGAQQGTALYTLHGG